MPPPGAPIRVARLVTRLNIGGPSTQVVELSSRLSARGFETLLIHGQIGAGEGDMSYLLERRSPPPRAVQVAALKRTISPASDARAAWQVYRLLCEFKPHIVHTHMAKAGAVGRLAAMAYNRTAGRRARARLVHTYHGHVLEGYFGRAKTRVFIAAERSLAAATDRIVAISPRIRDELVHDYRIGRAEQYRVVPLGFDLKGLAAIDDEARAAARAALEIAPGVPVVTTVGRLTAIKDQMLFLEVARRVTGEHGSAVFLIAGDGELRASLERAAEQFHIADRVRFLGWRRDLETVYGATDILLLTSRNEGTPVALIESLAAGCAGVSTDVGGVADVMPTTDVGLLAAARNVDQLADHVCRLIADPQRRRAMGEAGRRLVLGRYGIDRLVSDIERLYRDLLD
jgi:glycosyltransferase involved in cell wall biosynthesis